MAPYASLRGSKYPIFAVSASSMDFGIRNRNYWVLGPFGRILKSESPAYEQKLQQERSLNQCMDPRLLCRNVPYEPQVRATSRYNLSIRHIIGTRSPLTGHVVLQVRMRFESLTSPHRTPWPD